MMYGGVRSDHLQVMVPVINLKLMVDTARNRVVFAEADHEFIDILLSFLTLPLGTILKLLGEDIVHTGSISRMYASISKLEAKNFRTPTCKTMLLSPKNAAEVHCKKLKININPFTEHAGEYYICSSFYNCPKEDDVTMSLYPGTRCKRCGYSMSDVIAVAEEKDGSEKGVFVNGGGSTFIITDDLQIFPPSTATLIALFNKLGIKDGDELEERSVEIRRDEVLQLLKFSFLSKSAFTNAFLLQQGIIDTVKFESKKAAKSEKAAISQNSSMTLKLLISKSKRKLLYAEAGVEVVDLLFSFLTAPLGAMIKLLGKSSRLGCIDNLYKGAQELSTANYMKSEECKAMLVSPKLAPHFSFENHPFQMNEYPQFVLDSGLLRFATDATVEQGASSSDASEKARRTAVIMDPKTPTGETDNGKGYLKGPATFMITDNLLVTPLSPMSCIALLNKINVTINDLEERIITMGKEEALNLLRASLVSKSALSDVFSWRDPYPEVMLKI